MKKEIKRLEAAIGECRLLNDSRYWDLRRTWGDHSPEVLRHLETCFEWLIRSDCR